MPITDLLAWANDIEAVRLPLIESEHATLASEVSLRVQQFLDTFDAHMAQITASASSAGSAQTSANLALTNIYQTGLTAALYTDQQIQLLRDDLGGLVDGLAGYIGADLVTEFNAMIDAKITEMLANITAALAAIGATSDAITADYAQIEIATAQILDVVLPAQETSLQAILSEIAGVKSEIDLITVDFEYDTLAEAFDEAHQRTDALIPQIRSAEEVLDDAMLTLLDQRFEIDFLRKRGTDAGIYTDPATGLVRIAGVESLKDKLSSAEVRVDGVAAQVELRATYAWVNEAISNAILDPSQIPLLDDLQAQVSAVQILLDAQEVTIGLKADVITVDGLDVRVGAAELDIDALEGEILLRVTTAEFDALGDRVGTVEIEMSTLDIPTLNLTVQDVRRSTDEMDEADLATLEDLLLAYGGRKSIIEAMSSSQLQMMSSVNEQFVAESTARLAVQAELGAFKASSAVLYYTKVEVGKVVAGATTSLKASMEGPAGSIGQINATLTTDYYTKVAADIAISAATTTLKNSMEGPVGSIGLISANLSSNYYTRTATDGAITEKVDEMRSSMEAPGGSIGQINAALTDYYYTKVAADSAIALAGTTLQTEFLTGTQVTNFVAGGKYWTSSKAGKPAAVGSPTGWSFLTGPDRAQAIITGGVESSAIRQKALIPVSPGQAVDVYADLTVTAGGTGVGGIKLYWTWLRADYTEIDTTLRILDAAPGSPLVLSGQRDAPADAAWVRIGLIAFGLSYTGTATVDLRSLRGENVAATQAVRALLDVQYYTKTSADAAISQMITSLQSTMEGPGGSVKAAQDAAQAASNLAGGKGKVIVQNSAPAVADRLAQNLWIDTTSGANTPKRWNGTAWVAVTDKVATDAAAAAASALEGIGTINATLSTNYYTKTAADSAIALATTELRTSMEGAGGSVKAAQDAAQAASNLAGSKGKVLVRNAEPLVADRLTQNLWIDTSGGANTPKRWNGTAWVAVTDKVATDAAAAAAQAISDADAISSTLTADYYTRVNTDSAIAAQISVLESNYGKFNANGLLRISTEATPTGALSRIGLKAAASVGEGETRSAAIYLEAVTGGVSHALIHADRFAVINGDSRELPFMIEDGVVYMRKALIKTADIDTLKIAGNAVTVSEYEYLNTGEWLINNKTVETTLLSLTLEREAGYNTRLSFSCTLENPQSNGASATEIRLYRNSTLVYSWVMITPAIGDGLQDAKSFSMVDRNMAGGSTVYTIKAIEAPASSSRPGIVRKPFLEAQQFKR